MLRLLSDAVSDALVTRRRMKNECIVHDVQNRGIVACFKERRKTLISDTKDYDRLSGIRSINAKPQTQT